MLLQAMRNAANYALLNAAAKVLKLLALLGLARALPPERFAIVAFGWAYVEVFRVVAIAGLDVWTTRQLAQRPGSEVLTVRDSIRFARWSITIAVLLCTGSAVALGYSHSLVVGVCVAATVLPAAAVGPITGAAFDARLEARSLKGYYLVPALFNIAVAMLAVGSYLRSPTLILSVMVLGEYCGLAFLWRRMRRRFSSPVNTAAEGQTPTLRGVSPIAVQRLLWAVGYRVDLMILGVVASAAALGAYSAASKLAESLYLAGTAIGVSLFPLMTRVDQINRTEGKARVVSVSWITLSTMAVSSLGAVISVEVVRRFLSYPADRGTITALFLSVGWSVTNYLVTASQFARADSRRPAFAYATGLALFLVAALPLWHAFGTFGIASARLGQEMVAFFILVDRGRTLQNAGIDAVTALGLVAATLITMAAAELKSTVLGSTLAVLVAVSCGAAALGLARHTRPAVGTV